MASVFADDLVLFIATDSGKNRKNTTIFRPFKIDRILRKHSFSPDNTEV